MGSLEGDNERIMSRINTNFTTSKARFLGHPLVLFLILFLKNKKQKKQKKGQKKWIN